ncbi:DUF2867 domain-containing protein [Aquimarina sp. AD10]|uniref:DUF2867 domain-containing protein n=1 Tax=Aquimarina sp. AD10 TaxID=1714849 RepID=UPI000E4C6164|nr:DUF2867 domain-containing protein [Aquimarina sp. AD10]AXT59200.1 DUF2867 domain-containing protein [Aquimarina sp. AD10]RKM92690.1 DUF2867 domain-containing protein [Aquimarina sp. AD10]
MKVILENIPINSLINTISKKVDYSDTYATTNHSDSLDKITNKVFADFPDWVKTLMKLRNVIAKKIELKTQKPSDYSTEFKIGGYIGFFKIYKIMTDEINLGADDKHLDFRVSIYNSHDPTYNIKVSTIVQYNKSFGKVYMVIVKPFHKLIMKQIVKRAYTTKQI